MEKTQCKYCHRYYGEEKIARDCEYQHVVHEEVVFVPLLKEDLQRLAFYLMNGDRTNLTERLSRTILRYFRAEK